MTIDFVSWLEAEIAERGITQRWVELCAVDTEGRPLSKGTLHYILSRKRQPTAEHVIRIARALRVEPLQLLCLAGFMNPSEASLAKSFIPDNPHMYRIWQALIVLGEDELALVERPIIAIIEACREKGGQPPTMISGGQSEYG